MQDSNEMTGKKALSWMREIAALGAVTFPVLSPCPSSAEDKGTLIGDVAIDHVAATPAHAGETTRVSFSIENSETQRVVIYRTRDSGGSPVGRGRDGLARWQECLGRGRPPEAGPRS